MREGNAEAVASEQVVEEHRPAPRGRPARSARVVLLRERHLHGARPRQWSSACVSMSSILFGSASRSAHGASNDEPAVCTRLQAFRAA